MHEHELLVFILGTIVWGFIALYRHSLQSLPAVVWLYASYTALWLAWAATNLEHFFWPHLFNIVEHIGYAANGLLLFVWCWYCMKNNGMLQHD